MKSLEKCLRACFLKTWKTHSDEKSRRTNQFEPRSSESFRPQLTSFFFNGNRRYAASQKKMTAAPCGLFGQEMGRRNVHRWLRSLTWRWSFDLMECSGKEMKCTGKIDDLGRRGVVQTSCEASSECASELCQNLSCTLEDTLLLHALYTDTHYRTARIGFQTAPTLDTGNGKEKLGRTNSGEQKTCSNGFGVVEFGENLWLRKDSWIYATDSALPRDQGKTERREIERRLESKASSKLDG